MSRISDHQDVHNTWPLQFLIPPSGRKCCLSGILQKHLHSFDCSLFLFMWCQSSDINSPARIFFFSSFDCFVLFVVVVAAAVVAPPPPNLLSHWFIVGWLAHHRIAWLRTNVLLQFTHTTTESGTKSSNEKRPCTDSELTSGLETKLSRQIHSDRARNKSRGQVKQQWSLRPDGHVICTSIIRLATSSPKGGSTEQYWISVHCQDTAWRESSERGSCICRFKGNPGRGHKWPEHVESVQIFPCASFVCGCIVWLPILMQQQYIFASTFNSQGSSSQLVRSLPTKSTNTQSVCVLINKRSFEPFMCLDLVLEH